MSSEYPLGEPGSAGKGPSDGGAGPDPADSRPLSVEGYPPVSMAMDGKAVAIFQWTNGKWILMSAVGALSSLEVKTTDSLTQAGRFEGQRILVGIRLTDSPIEASFRPED